MKWSEQLLVICGATILLLLGIIGWFSSRTLESIEDELKGVKSEIRAMNHDYGMLAQNVNVFMAVNGPQKALCQFPKTKNQKEN